MKYDYKCKDCQADFFIICSVNDKREHVHCSKCASENVRRIFNAKILTHLHDNEPEKKTESNENIIQSEHSHHEHQCSPELDYI